MKRSSVLAALRDRVVASTLSPPQKRDAMVAYERMFRASLTYQPHDRDPYPLIFLLEAAGVRDIRIDSAGFTGMAADGKPVKLLFLTEVASLAAGSMDVKPRSRRPVPLVFVHRLPCSAAAPQPAQLPSSPVVSPSPAE